MVLKRELKGLCNMAVSSSTRVSKSVYKILYSSPRLGEFSILGDLQWILNLSIWFGHDLLWCLVRSTIEVFIVDSWIN